MELGFSFFLISFRQMQKFIRTVALLSQEHPAIFFLRWKESNRFREN